MICYKGTIITVDSNDNIFNYLIEDRGKILFVGNLLPQEYKDVKIKELGEKVLIPSFCDSHQHFASFAMFHAGLNVMEAESNVQIMEMIKDYVEVAKGKILIAFGASPYSV